MWKTFEEEPEVLGQATAEAAAESEGLLVGEPVLVANSVQVGVISQGTHGVEEHVAPGTPSKYYANTGFISGYQVPGWCCT